MNRGGRPGSGLAHVDSLEGPLEAKHRLKLVLATICGETSVNDACEELGLHPSRFHEIRRLALEGALGSLLPGESGRPRRARDLASTRIGELEQEVRVLEWRLKAAAVREELALVLPSIGKKSWNEGRKEGLNPRMDRARRSPRK